MESPQRQDPALLNTLELKKCRAYWHGKFYSLSTRKALLHGLPKGESQDPANAPDFPLQAVFLKDLSEIS